MPHAASVGVRVALASLMLACASGSNGFALPTIVRFSFEAVTPQTAEVPPGGVVIWENEVPDSTGYVVFPASIASSFTCDHLGPYFLKTAEGYRSLPITPDIESERVQLPCPLAAGSYDYEIMITGSGFGASVGGGTTLRGRIVVK